MDWCTDIKDWQFFLLDEFNHEIGASMTCSEVNVEFKVEIQLLWCVALVSWSLKYENYNDAAVFKL